MPVRVLITEGTRADCGEAHRLTEGLDAANLLADKGYDTDAIVETCKAKGMTPVIPPKRNRNVQREYDHDIYRERHLMENAFEKLKRWRGIATPLRQKHRLIPRRRPHQMPCYLAWHLVTTLP